MFHIFCESKYIWLILCRVKILTSTCNCMCFGRAFQMCSMSTARALSPRIIASAGICEVLEFWKINLFRVRATCQFLVFLRATCFETRIGLVDPLCALTHTLSSASRSFWKICSNRQGYDQLLFLILAILATCCARWTMLENK